ncbi:MAG: hypothetical protein Q7T57_09290 [Dehalococcoidales bacterium]|nr:hypothetical protein [Dehalococcoidales bacterium]
MWKILKILGYIIAIIFGVNLVYCGLPYMIRHEDWFFIYNPTFNLFGKYRTNEVLAWQILYSIILLILGGILISIADKKLKKRP